jgi:hypothetical protein
MKIRAAVLVVLLGARVASADSSEQKSPDLALALSASGTVVSLGLIIGGAHQFAHTTVGPRAWLTVSAVGLESTLITPSLGQWYAGKFMTTGLALRLAGAAVAAGGVASAGICFSDNCHGDSSAAVLLAGLGILTYTIGVGWDLATVRPTTRESNARHAPVINPSVLTTSSGHSVYGLGVGGNF